MNTSGPNDPPPARARHGPALLLGLVAGLAVGAGGLGAAWAYSAGSADPDVEIVCTAAERLPLASRQNNTKESVSGWLKLGLFGRWLAEEDPTYQPLADALDETYRSFNTFEREWMEVPAERVKQICADL